LLVRELFTNGRGRVTLLVWAIVFANLLDLNLLSNWLPTMLRDAGLPIQTAALITVGYQVGGTAGAILLGLLFDRFPPFLVLVLSYGVAFLGVLCIGLVGTNVALLYAIVFVAGFCVIGGVSGSCVLVADCYPTAVRATGLGWALGIGRIGAIFGPTVGGIALGLNWSATAFFAVGALPMLCAGAAALGIHKGARAPVVAPGVLEPGRR
jgi:AAHS family 4-hydroxybenzoate transporter-like MFS transporter